MEKSQKNHMEKDEFQTILKRVEHRQFGQLNLNEKTELVLTHKNKTTPFEGIRNDVPSKGSYWLDSQGFLPYFSQPGCYGIQPGFYGLRDFNDLKDFIEYPYKNEAERIKVVKELNKNFKTRNEIRDKTFIELSFAQFGLQDKKGKDREKVLKEITKLKNTFFPSITIFIPEYPVILILKWVSKDHKTIYFTIDNKTLYKLCLHDNKKTITARWNKTVLEDYEEKGKVSERYKKYAELFREWFFDNGIDVNKVDSLIDEQPVKELVQGPQKIPNKWQRDKKTDLTFTEEKYIELNTLTDEFRNEKPGSVNKRVREVYDKNKKTVFKEVNYGKGWNDSSLNGYYYKGKKLNKKAKMIV